MIFLLFICLNIVIIYVIIYVYVYVLPIMTYIYVIIPLNLQKLLDLLFVFVVPVPGFHPPPLPCLPWPFDYHLMNLSGRNKHCFLVGLSRNNQVLQLE